MAWINLKSSITNKIISIPESAYNNFYQGSTIFKKVEPGSKKDELKKTIKPKEENLNVEDLHIVNKTEINSSGKNKKATGV